MALTKENLDDILFAVKDHPESEAVMDRLGNALLEEMDLDVKYLLDSFIEGDVDGMIAALTGWCMESLLAKAGIIPDYRGYFPSVEQKDVVFPQMPWEMEQK